ncbi:hypothetical protein Q31a_34770 [Aureliella helgolandensis]|uniref:Uncharacterized protein n=1 Tax=Aureliella helgolandensis TaxID=2527968 RepID=A0A518G978_9BACT|nr:hypothetical protein Q31a_34770 [Aureliella helgolandensis]
MQTYANGQKVPRTGSKMDLSVVNLRSTSFFIAG